MKTFRRKYKARDGMRRAVAMEVIGSRPDCAPYLRVGTADGKMIAALDGNALKHLGNAIYEALTGKKRP